VIGRVYRGERVAGLVRYLYGPGRHNEHVDARLVAAWDAHTPGELAAMEPPVGERGAADYRPMIDSLELALALRAKGERLPVWHCPLRVAPGDRSLSDAEWAQVARDVMDRTGIARRGDDGGARCVAVRHDADSIHLVAVLARQDGRRCHPEFDHLRVREACLAAEVRYGLVSTAPADGTATPANTRAETEKAARTGRGEEARSQLRREVRAEAVGASNVEEFLAGLRGRGLFVRERYSTVPGQEQVLTGYAVAAAGDRDRAGELVYFGGGKLAADLSLPRLAERWATSGAADSPADGQAAAGRAGLLRDATGHAQAAAGVLEAVTGQVAGGADPAGEAAGVTLAAGEALVAAAAVFEGSFGGPLTPAAAAYDRAARPPRAGGGQVRWEQGEAARRLQNASRAVARAGRLVGRADRTGGMDLVAALVTLVGTVARLHAASGRTQQARAAHAAQQQVRDWRDGRPGLAGSGQPLGRAVPGLAQRPAATPPVYRSEPPRRGLTR